MHSIWALLIPIGALSVAAVGFVIWPLFRRLPVSPPPDGEELAELLTRKETTLQAIRELEFDHSVGKIEEADFERFNRALRRRAIALLRRIDQFDASRPQTSADSPNVTDPPHTANSDAPAPDPGRASDAFNLDKLVEEEIAALRRVEELHHHEGRDRLQKE